MKKKRVMFFGAFAIVFILILVAGVIKFNFINDDVYTQKPNKRFDQRNSTYQIDAESINFVDGKAEKELMPDSNSKEIFQYFGDDIKADFNKDGFNDIAFIITKNSGGSGVFYYLALAWGSKDGFSGSNAVLIGDRISPLDTQYTNGEIIVNYLDREPSHFKINGDRLLEITK
jgi:hypothetical protein